MNTRSDTPEAELLDAMRSTGTKTQREAVVNAVAEFNRRQRMGELTRYAGTCANLIAATELQVLRRMG